MQRNFNLLVIFIFLIGLVLAGYVIYTNEIKQARQVLAREAQLMMAGALATRNYTVKEIKPLLASLESGSEEFFPQTVPSYAAHSTFALFNPQYEEYKYREIAINPTNPENRPTAWELGIIQQFRDEPDTEEIILERKTARGELMHLAHPIVIKDPACLQCHGTVMDAPAAMRAKYGTANGFGWTLGETVGTQIITVPTSLAMEQSRETIITVLAVLLSVFALLFISINMALRRWVVQPLAQLVNSTEQISLGESDAEHMPELSKGELGRLCVSIKRLARSMQTAMDLNERQQRENRQ